MRITITAALHAILSSVKESIFNLDNWSITNDDFRPLSVYHECLNVHLAKLTISKTFLLFDPNVNIWSILNN